MKFLSVILYCAVVYFAYTVNLYLGLAATVAVLLYLIIKIIPFSYRYKSRKALAEGRFEDAKQFYKKALKNMSINFDTRMEYTYILLRTGDFEEAQQNMDKILSYKLDPQKRNLAVLQRCMCYYKNGNLDEAYTDITELYNDGYRSIMLYGLLGYFKLLKAPHSQDTFDFCTEAYDYADDDRDICDNMLMCYYNQGEYHKAKEISDRIIEASPKFVEAWYHAAQIDVALGDYTSAKNKLDKIPECNRSNMTTIPIKDVEKLTTLVDNKLKEKK